MSKIFIISDTHFGHEKIIEYCNRPFDNTFIMNQTIINNWNKVVAKNDIVWHLGDVLLGSSEQLYKIVQQLNGTKYLIRGNHCKSHSDGALLKAGFKTVYKYPIILEKKYILSHAPLELAAGSNFCNIHGHEHSNGPTKTDKNYYNVSVEMINYKPLAFNIIKKHFNTYNT